eukprot:CAMPEP_0172620770 /NCGR_PEP_ID=MMETSP1068-20121228/106135_1 /TAXON_ID=35684 /ORGANISM="Pseudopedinella elastica, Strain CCMP716" /LENGTH=69 /DNA_ID=CAMNT_0013428171 /DNA_START=643 /DNA_END=850 /DNA_ORIENTATION=-
MSEITVTAGHTCTALTLQLNGALPPGPSGSRPRGAATLALPATPEGTATTGGSSLECIVSWYSNMAQLP